VYAAQLLALVVVVFALDPRGAEDVGWSVALDYAHGDFAAANVVFALAFLLPPLAASVAYLGLWLKLREPVARLRIALVGGSIFAWLVVALVGARTPSGADAPQATLKALSTLVALVALVAFAPPPFLRERVQLPAGSEAAYAPPTREELAARRQALAERVERLI